MDEQGGASYKTSISVLVVLERKCALATSRAAPWWVTLGMRRALY